MKSQVVLILLLLSAMGMIARSAPVSTVTVAVYNFTDPDFNGSDYGRKVTALVTTELTSDTNLVMLERADLAKALNEQAFDSSGMVSSDAAARFGQITGVKVLVAGQVIRIRGEHLVLIANIIGTETGRLFAAKVEGAADQLTTLSTDLGRKIARVIGEHGDSLVAPPIESPEERWTRAVKDIHGTNRPSVEVNITFIADNGNHWHDDWSEFEFVKVLMKAGFPVVKKNSDHKADIQITGDASVSEGPSRGELVTRAMALQIKIQERRTGVILGFDRQQSMVTGVGSAIVARAAHEKAVDEVAVRVLPLLAK